MSDTVYRLALDCERDDVIDFGNYVFSQAHVPHDFKTLLPKAYADHLPRLGAEHFIAVRDNRIRAMVALKRLYLNVPSNRLKLGFIGTVSVHPYARGEGHMKALMAMAIQYARDEGMDMLVLGGNRQRYNWFGFETAGWAMRLAITRSSFKHALRDVDDSAISIEPLDGGDPAGVAFARSLALGQAVVCDRPEGEFMDIMRSWNSTPRLIRHNGEMAGYVSGRVSEITLTDESLLLPVIKRIYAEENSDYTIVVPPHETGRLAALSPVAGSVAITGVEMINVLNWERTLQALLDLRASFRPLACGRLTLRIDDGAPITIEAADGRARVFASALAPDVCLSHMEAQRRLFGLDVFALGSLCADWFPLPFWMSPMDTF